MHYEETKDGVIGYIEDYDLEWLIQLYINQTLNKEEHFTLVKVDDNNYELRWNDGKTFCTVYRDKVIEILRYMLNEEE